MNELEMDLEHWYARNYRFLAEEGLNIPMFKKEEAYWNYIHHITKLKLSNLSYNSKLEEFIKEFRKGDMDVFLEKVKSN